MGQKTLEKLLIIQKTGVYFSEKKIVVHCHNATSLMGSSPGDKIAKELSHALSKLPL